METTVMGYIGFRVWPKPIRLNSKPYILQPKTTSKALQPDFDEDSPAYQARHSAGNGGRSSNPVGDSPCKKPLRVKRFEGLQGIGGARDMM